MDDFVASPKTGSDPNPVVGTASQSDVASAPARQPRRRLSRWLMLGVVVSIALALAAGLVMISAGKSRRTASDRLDTATTRLKSSRLDAARAKSQLAHAQSEGRTEDDSLATVLVTIHKLGQLTDQGTAYWDEIVQAGENGTEYEDIYSYNMLIDKFNALADMRNATFDQMDMQISRLPNL